MMTAKTLIAILDSGNNFVFGFVMYDNVTIQSEQPG